MNIYGLIWEFCVRKLARILYDCVECSHKDRDMLDWSTAERFMQTNSSAVTEVISAFLAQPSAAGFSRISLVRNLPSSIDTSYEGLERALGKTVWEKLYQPLRLALGAQFNTPHHTRIIFG